MRAFPGLLIVHDNSFNAYWLTEVRRYQGRADRQPRVRVVCSVAPSVLDCSLGCICSANIHGFLMRPLAAALIGQMSQSCGFPRSQIAPEMPAVNRMSIFRPFVPSIGNRHVPGLTLRGWRLPCMMPALIRWRQLANALYAPSAMSMAPSERSTFVSLSRAGADRRSETTPMTISTHRASPRQSQAPT